MIHKLAVTNLHNSTSEHNLYSRLDLVKDVKQQIFKLICTYGGKRYPSLDIWIGLTGGWHFEVVIKNLSARKTVAIKCENIKAIEHYIKYVMNFGVHAVKEQGEDQVFHFFDTQDQLSMQKRIS